MGKKKLNIPEQGWTKMTTEDLISTLDELWGRELSVKEAKQIQAKFKAAQDLVEFVRKANFYTVGEDEYALALVTQYDEAGEREE